MSRTQVPVYTYTHRNIYTYTHTNTHTHSNNEGVIHDETIVVVVDADDVYVASASCAGAANNLSEIILVVTLLFTCTHVPHGFRILAPTSEFPDFFAEFLFPEFLKEFRTI